MIDEARLFRALDRILDHLVRLKHPVVKMLQPPLTAAEVAAVEATLPFQLTEEVRAIYRWRNGITVSQTDILAHQWFFPGYYFPSLQEARLRFEGRKNAPQWHRGWYPLFDSGAGDFYIVPCKKKAQESTPVIGFLHGEPEQPVEYLSVVSMVETLAECYEKGAFFLNDQDRLDVDDDAQARLARRHNPGLAEWQS
jgi:cell wall assembly regulator SMI1